MWTTECRLNPNWSAPDFPFVVDGTMVRQRRIIVQSTGVYPQRSEGTLESQKFRH